MCETVCFLFLFWYCPLARSSTGTLENTSVATITQKQSEEEQNVASLGSLEHKEDLFIIDTADHCKDDQIRHEVSQGHLQGIIKYNTHKQILIITRNTKQIKK